MRKSYLKKNNVGYKWRTYLVRWPLATIGYNLVRWPNFKNITLIQAIINIPRCSHYDKQINNYMIEVTTCQLAVFSLVEESQKNDITKF